MPDASLIGYRFPSFSFPVEEGKLRELQAALLWDGGGAPAPTFSALASFWSIPDPGDSLGMDLKRLLHGGSTWQYHAPVRAGDRLTVHSSVVDVRQKQGRRGGLMTIVVREERYENQHGELVMVRSSEIIEVAPTQEST